MKQIARWSLRVAIAFALFGLIEAVLWSFGVGRVEASDYLLRGFDERADYLIPDPEREGGWRTQFRWHKDRTIAARDGRCRVLLFGGSNTAGFPAGFLADRLNEGLIEPRFEVVNLGRGGYGSARVRILFGQALEHLDPDIVVIYSGHNEFVEHGFRADVERSFGHGRTADVARLASHTRTFQVLQEAFAARRESPQSLPENWRGEYAKFDDISYERSLFFLDAYRQNLEWMCDAATEQGVKVVLSTVVANRFAPPNPFVGNELERDEVIELERLRNAAHAHLPEFVRTVVVSAPRMQVHSFDWLRPGTRTRHARATELPGFRSVTGWLADFDPLIPEPSAWNEKATRFADAYGRFASREFTTAQRAALIRAEELLAQAHELAARNAPTLFELGAVMYLLGRDAARTSELLHLAGRYEIAPRKANDAVHERVRAVASARREVLFVDAEARFRECHEYGIVGWEWMLDNCHLSSGGRRALMQLFASAIRARWPALTAQQDTR